MKTLVKYEDELAHSSIL